LKSFCPHVDYFDVVIDQHRRNRKRFAHTVDRQLFANNVFLAVNRPRLATDHNHDDDGSPSTDGCERTNIVEYIDCIDNSIFYVDHIDDILVDGGACNVAYARAKADRAPRYSTKHTLPCAINSRSRHLSLAYFCCSVRFQHGIASARPSSVCCCFRSASRSTRPVPREARFPFALLLLCEERIDQRTTNTKISTNHVTQSQRNDRVAVLRRAPARSAGRAVSGDRIHDAVATRQRFLVVVAAAAASTTTATARSHRPVRTRRRTLSKGTFYISMRNKKASHDTVYCCVDVPLPTQHDVRLCWSFWTCRLRRTADAMAAAAGLLSRHVALHHGAWRLIASHRQCLSFRFVCVGLDRSAQFAKCDVAGRCRSMRIRARATDPTSNCSYVFLSLALLAFSAFHHRSSMCIGVPNPSPVYVS
jgi:hypothetical protein